jgi:hypothetical protein
MEGHHISYIVICLKSTGLKLFENLKVFKFDYFNLKEALLEFNFFGEEFLFFKMWLYKHFRFLNTSQIIMDILFLEMPSIISFSLLKYSMSITKIKWHNVSLMINPWDDTRGGVSQKLSLSH